VGGVGAGGKGLYALNISDPAAPTDDAGAASKIMWEITPTTINNTASASYSELGYTYGIPVIGKTPDGAWVAIVGNGYNNQGLNQAVLYVINLADGTLKAAIPTSSPQATSDANPNGLSSPTAIDTNYDGKIDYVYAGDINGNMWKFTHMTVSRLYTTNPPPPITGRPAVSLHPLGGYMVNFATGRMFTSADATDTTAYYAYGIRDSGTLPIPTDTNIVSQTLIPKTWTATGGFNYAVRVSSSNAVDYAAGKQGWKLQLPAGERVVGDGGLVTNRRFIFASTNPTIPHPPTGGVDHPQGDNWLNEVDFTTGGGGTSPQFDLDANFTLDDGDRVRGAGGVDPQAGPTGIPVSRYIVSGVMSQPIVARLQSLSQTYFNTNPDYVSSPAPPGDPGVSGGHFDFDIYYGLCTVSSSSYSCANKLHVHEYDDKFDVTGVNMLDPSLPAFNILNAIPSGATQFKILMSNQKYSPAVKFLVGGATGVPVTSYETTAGVTMASRTTYTRTTDAVPATVDLGSFTLALPLDAFQSKDWAGTGDVRAGLVPTVTGCVHATRCGDHRTGPWMNGADDSDRQGRPHRRQSSSTSG
jgi:Tfp pilus tip-associated adhesin PilY1